MHKLSQEAYSDGLKRFEAKGSLKKYYDYLYLSKDKKATRISIYKNYVFIYKDNVLITMFPLIGRYQKMVQEQVDRRNKNGNK